MGGREKTYWCIRNDGYTPVKVTYSQDAVDKYLKKRKGFKAFKINLATFRYLKRWIKINIKNKQLKLWH